MTLPTHQTSISGNARLFKPQNSLAAACLSPIPNSMHPWPLSAGDHICAAWQPLPLISIQAHCSARLPVEVSTKFRENFNSIWTFLAGV